MKYGLWFSRIEGITAGKRRLLLEAAGSAEAVYGMPRQVLCKIKGLSETDVERDIRSRESWDIEGRAYELMEHGISFVSIEQKQYPKNLRNIHNAPYGLYYRGNLPEEKKRSVGIVGSRRRSEYGRYLAREMGKELAENDIQVISGMALGIDTDGHTGALDGNGKTFAVLGCGVDVCYPRSNRWLYDRIIRSGGGILSEYPMGQAPIASQFPSRNRIISGLSDAVVIVEARKKSGSLITADFALEQGKDVYAVPGRITDSLSEGCNGLIAQGAGIIGNISEFVHEQTNLTEKSYVQMDFRKIFLEKDESLVYSLLDFCPISLGTLLEQAELSLTDLLRILQRLEDKGYAKESVPNYFVRCL